MKEQINRVSTYRAVVFLATMFMTFAINAFIAENAFAATIYKECTVSLSNFNEVKDIGGMYLLNTTVSNSVGVGDTVYWTVHIYNDTNTSLLPVSVEWEPNTNSSNVDGDYVDNCLITNSDLFPGGTATWKLWVKMNKSGTQNIEIRYAGGGPYIYNCYLATKFTNGATGSAVSSAPVAATLSQVNTTGSATTSQTATTGTSAATTTTAAVSIATPSIVTSSATSSATNNTAGATVGRQEQGPLGKMLFSQAMPAGWNEACSYNIVIGGRADFSQKNGPITIDIPQEYCKVGRTFALLGIDSSGQVLTFTDTDSNPNTITVNLNLQGYAVDLIYKD